MSFLDRNPMTIGDLPKRVQGAIAGIAVVITIVLTIYLLATGELDGTDILGIFIAGIMISSLIAFLIGGLYMLLSGKAIISGIYHIVMPFVVVIFVYLFIKLFDAIFAFP